MKFIYRSHYHLLWIPWFLRPPIRQGFRNREFIWELPQGSRDEAWGREQKEEELGA